MKKNGFSLLEIVIAIGLAIAFLPAIAAVLSFSLNSTSQGEKYTQAYSLAQQQMEAIYLLKEAGDSSWDWINTPVNTSAGQYYQPQLSGGNWILGTIVTDPDESEGFTKIVQINPAKRDGSGNLSEAEWAVIDDHSRWIRVEVIWLENGEPAKVELQSLVTYR